LHSNVFRAESEVWLSGPQISIPDAHSVPVKSVVS
jgi:hypothetical protein